jgi:hypothetical protein
MEWSACFGLALIVTAHYFSNLPFSIYANSDFWLNSPGLIFIRFGIVLVLAAAGFVWTAGQSAEKLAFVRRLGTNSLLIYWVHVELVYGRWFWFAKQRLTIGECAAASLLLIALMYGLATPESSHARQAPVTPLAAGCADCGDRMATIATGYGRRHVR